MGDYPSLDTRPLRVASGEDLARILHVSRETLGKLQVYAETLRHWQKTTNLIASSTLPDLWQRHFADSAQLIELIMLAAGRATAGSHAPNHVRQLDAASSESKHPSSRTSGAEPSADPGPSARVVRSTQKSVPPAPPTLDPGSSSPLKSGSNVQDDGDNSVRSEASRPVSGSGRPLTLLDLGSGAGFPGKVLAILLAGRPATAPARVHLVESNAKKCAFLREAARRTSTLVEIHAERIETLVDKRTVDSVDVVTARALAPLDKLLGMAAPFLSPSAVGLFLKGRDVGNEIEAARRHWRFEARLVQSRTDPDGRIAVVTSLERNRGGLSQ